MTDKQLKYIIIGIIVVYLIRSNTPVGAIASELAVGA